MAREKRGRGMRLVWRDIKDAPKDDHEPFLVFIPNGAPDIGVDLVLQVTSFEGQFYPCHLNFNVDWSDRIQGATHFCDMLETP